MTELLKNAVDSLAIGIEDYSANDPRRTLSAVRNFYAGALLLAKEVLSQMAPKADPDEILGAKYKPVPDGKGGVEFVQDGSATIDFQTIGKRFKDFGIKADPKRLEHLNKIRNDIEHRYTTQTDATIREAIATAFPLISDLFREIGESPVERLGDAWQKMLEVTHFYEAELKLSRETLRNIRWRSGSMSPKHLECGQCGSALVAQADPQETDQDNIGLVCKACGAEQDTGDAIEAALGEALRGEAYLRVKDEGRDGPIYTCAECLQDTFIDFEDQCANCGFTPEGESECSICGEGIELELRMQGEDLCSYCSYKMDKIRDE